MVFKGIFVIIKVEQW